MQRLRSWRLIVDDGVTASCGLAADDALARRVGLGQSQATLRLYTYRSHCALVGRFQRVENEIHLDWCRAHGIAINRRPTGGGAILMGRDQLGVALLIPGHGEDVYGRAREQMGKFSESLIAVLETLGIKAQFRRKNDIEVAGRKIAGLGIYRATGGGLLFHASLLVDLDIALMLQVLQTPFEKISDKEITTVAGRITTVRRETGSRISVDEVRRAVAAAFPAVFDAELVPGDFTTQEQDAIASLEKEKYQTNEWVFQTTEVPDTVGSAMVKTPGGLLDVRVALAGRMLKAVFLAGDFFAAEGAVAALEGALRWHPSAPDAVAATVRAACARHPASWHDVPLESLLEAIQSAIRRAENGENKTDSVPYGCFIAAGRS